MTILFIGDIGGGEMLLIILVILLFFGSKNIPQLARGLGRGIREFKDATSGIQREIEKTMYEEPERTYTKTPSISPPEKLAAAETNAPPSLETTEDKPKVEVPTTAAVLPEIKPAEGTVSRLE